MLQTASTTDIELTYALPSGTTKVADFLYLARADILKAQTVNKCLLRSSPDNVTYTSRLGTTAAFQTRTFSGPRAEDLVFTRTFNDDTGGVSVSGFRYWKLVIGCTSNSKRPFSKAYFGSFFDFGRDPVYPVTITRVENGSTIRDSAHQVVFIWEGITDAKRIEFQTSVAKYQQVTPLVLYTTSYHDVMFDFRSLPVWLKDLEFNAGPVPGINTLTATFEEVI